jgi:hypothetical protein
MSIPDLDFRVESAAPLRFSASPHVEFKLRVSNRGGRTVHSVLLKSQIHLDAARRHYTKEEQARLTDLFGEPHRWGETLRSLLWATTTHVIPSFSDETVLDMAVPCTFDFNIAATKYCAGINDGDIPVAFYFSGTVFYAGEAGSLQAAQISWEKEAVYRMPAAVWRDMMDIYYPNTAWLCLSRTAFDRLYDYKVRRGLVRRLHAVSVPSIFAEEPASLEFRSRLPRRTPTFHDANRVLAGSR